MSDRARRLLEQALALPLEDRAFVARELSASLDEADDPSDEVEAEWHAEIASRVREIEDGTAELHDGESVLRELRAKYPPRSR